MVNIRVMDGTDVPHPEDNAMLQALYSRSPASVSDHLEKVQRVGSGKFMGEYYIGYNHASIGDCGTITIYVEGVSMLVAKAFQDWPLYSGQEASTRYMDFSKVEIEDPLNTPASSEIQKRWMSFYFSSKDQVADHVRATYPSTLLDTEKAAKQYERTVAARTFDILRAFIPAGAHTNFSWHTNLRQAADKLAVMVYHPDSVVRNVALRVRDKLRLRYPNSFSDKVYAETELYREYVGSMYTYSEVHDHRLPSLIFDMANHHLTPYQKLFACRPPKAELPRFLAVLGNIRSRFMLDFGSFRDLQRHRNGFIGVPLLTTDQGFESWYIDQLPSNLQEDAKRLITQQTEAINSLPSSSVLSQYYVALGYRVPCVVSQSLPALVYRVELRAGKMVHPTLRRIAHLEAEQISKYLPTCKLHIDTDADDLDVRRGMQTIEVRA